MVNKTQVKKVLESLRKDSKKRKFAQAVDLIINFKNLDLKKNPIDSFVILPHEFSKAIKVCAFIDDDFSKSAEASCDRIIRKTDLENWKDSKAIKKLGREFDFFIAQANLMGLVATKFGRTLGPLGKMPNPKFGGVVSPGADLKPVVTRFKKSIRITCKNELIIKTRVAYEDMDDDNVVSNFMHIYDHIAGILPHHEHNIGSVILKFTMGKPVIVGKKEETKERDVHEKKIVEKEKSLEKEPQEKKEESKDE
jgi:large subunit ribosomal protein L1